MAQIDLRNALVEILDGYAVAGVVGGSPAGYAVGVSTVAVDTSTMAIPALSYFTIGANIYQVVSSVGGATPTSFTFTPPLVAAVADNAVLTFQVTALINNGAGYLASGPTTTMAIDNIAVAIPNGKTFKMAGDATVYTVSSTVGGATPTSVTLTPQWAADVVDDQVMTFLPTAAINQPGSGPSTGDTTVTVTGFSAAIPNGLQFTVAGADQIYTVVSTVGGSTPSSITFAPPFATGDGVPVGGAIITIGPHALEIKIGEGTLTYNEKRNMEYVHNRRAVAFVRTGDDEPMDVNFDFIWEFLKAASGETITIEEALKGTAAAVAAGWVTSGSDPCEPYSTDIRITYTPPCSNVAKEIITLAEYRWEGGNHDLKAGTVSSSGKCKVSQAELQRIAQSA